MGQRASRRCGALLALLLGIALPAPAQAQIGFDVVGTRALGMAGAFVAVADDATAGFWNPAGLVKGPMAGLTIAGDTFHFRDPKGPPEPGAWRYSTQSAALGTWPVGITFARVDASAISNDADAPGTAESLTTMQLGFTVLQSLGDFVVVGATAKFVRGTAAIAPIAGQSAEDALDAIEQAPAHSSGTFDLDLGVIAGTDRWRAAFALKNLRRPTFDTIGGKPIALERRARLGLAAFPRDGLTLAIDVDLDTADPLVGLRRTIALGGETRLGVHLFLRAGMRWERGEAGRPIGALGGSVSIRQGFWLDGYFTRGHSGEHQGFGFALRAGS